MTFCFILIVDENLHPWIVWRRIFRFMQHLPKVIPTPFDVSNRLPGRSPIASVPSAQTQRIPQARPATGPSDRLPNRNGFLYAVLKYRSYSSQKCLIDRDNLSNFSTMRSPPMSATSATPRPVGPHILSAGHHVPLDLHQLDSVNGAVPSIAACCASRTFPPLLACPSTHERNQPPSAAFLAHHNVPRLLRSLCSLGLVSHCGPYSHSSWSLYNHSMWALGAD